MKDLTITCNPWPKGAYPSIIIDPENNEVYVWTQEGQEEYVIPDKWEEPESVYYSRALSIRVPTGPHKEADPDDLLSWLESHRDRLTQIISAYRGRDSNGLYGLWRTEEHYYKLITDLNTAMRDDGRPEDGKIRVYQDADDP